MARLTYQGALDYLYSFIDYSVKRSYRYSPETFDLGRVRELLARLGDPQDAYASIHIAGTKGKGSVSAMIESCLRAAGLKTGLYTSPHLQRFTERIQVDGREIRPEDVVAMVERLRPQVEKVAGLTTYELITALGFLYFEAQDVDCAVIEVGLGGRLDATNVVMPLVSVITSISYDHMHLLGDSLSDIAREKAGIIKPGVPVVASPQQYEVERVLQGVAEERNAELGWVGKDWLFAPGRRDLGGQVFYVWSAEEQPMMEAYIESAGDDEWAPPRFTIPLLGYHQIVNAATAYGALQVARRQGVPVTMRAIEQGLRNVHWPGRFQVLAQRPVVVVDSAHNRDSALKLRLALDDYFPSQPVTLIFGASADKDISGMLAELMPRVARIIVTQAAHPRSAEPEMLERLALRYGMRVEAVVPVAQALRHALQRALPDEVILATGSLFVVGEVLTSWEQVESELASLIPFAVR